MSAIKNKFAELLPATLSSSTKNAYISLLNQMWNKAMVLESAAILKNWGNWVYEYRVHLMEWIDTEDFKPTTKRNYYNVMLVVCKGLEHDEQIREGIRKLNKEIDDMDGEQSLDAKELQYFKSHEELLEILQVFQKQVEDLAAWKDSRPMTHEEAFGYKDGWIVLFRFLAFLVMVEQPPVRGDWGIVRCKGEGNENYVWLEDSVIVIRKDKVSKKYGSAIIPICEDVVNILRKSFRVWPRLYVFPNKFDPGLPMGVQPFCEFLRLAEHPVTQECMFQGVQLLRASYITWFYDDKTHTLNSKQQLAKYMRHSQPTAEKCYRKLV